MTNDIDTFLVQLQKEAENQAKLSKTRILPSHLDGLTSLVGRYAWQTVTLASFFTTVAVQILKRV